MLILDLHQSKAQGKLAADPRTEFMPSDFKSNILSITPWLCPFWGLLY